MTLDEIDITDNLIWQDEFAYNQVVQEQERSLTGGLIVQSGIKQYGQPVTLVGWLSRAMLDALRAKEGSGNPVMDLAMDDGREFSVIFNRASGVAVEASPIKETTHISQEPSAWYSATLRLLTVEPPA